VIAEIEPLGDRRNEAILSELSLIGGLCDLGIQSLKCPTNGVDSLHGFILILSVASITGISTCLSIWKTTWRYYKLASESPRPWDMQATSGDTPTGLHPFINTDRSPDEIDVEEI
jgi:hypothetical protein